ncbi:uclacyanin 1 [Magnolia sinica]|uniref:uclacyanin 1 n=1 Tax=Magnolia sinica TaxID=86752 RepID=UPI002657EE4E|nr:uclacyanin 1 [Magnolia sinica]
MREHYFWKMQGLYRVVAVAMVMFVGWATREAHATKHVVGGSDGWDVTADLDTWTAGQTFRVGDELVFKYTPGLHSVVELASEKDYNKCNMNNALDSLNGGTTVVKLDKPGYRYFTCGTVGHCDEGMKLKVNTLTGNGTASSSPASASTSSATLAHDIASSVIMGVSVGFGLIGLV